MSTNFFRLPYSVNYPGASKIDETKAAPLVTPTPPPDAVDVWDFGASADSLAGVVHEISMNLRSASKTADPTYGENYIDIPGGERNGVYAAPEDLNGSAGQTFFGVFRVADLPEGSNSTWFGNYHNAEGFTVYQSAVAAGSPLRCSVGGFAGVTLDLPPAVVVGDYVFAAIALEADQYRLFFGAGPTHEAEGAYVQYPTNAVGVGNFRRVSSSHYGAVRSACFGALPGAMSFDAMQMLYLSTKARMRSRGIIVK